MKILGPKIHGMLDYGLAAFFLILPPLLNFSEPAATVSYVIGVIYVGASLITRYPLGLLKILPFPIHGILESVMAAVWIILPWLFGFSEDVAARNFFIIAGVALLGVVALTDYQGEGKKIRVMD